MDVLVDVDAGTQCFGCPPLNIDWGGGVQVVKSWDEREVQGI